MSGFFEEIKRRSVIRVAGLYLTGCWLLLQIAGTVLAMLDAPGWVARTLLLVLLSSDCSSPPSSSRSTRGAWIETPAS